MRKADGFQIIEYIRSSIEIIMNLKVEDLEKELKNRPHASGDHDKLESGGSSASSLTSSMINP